MLIRCLTLIGILGSVAGCHKLPAVGGKFLASGQQPVVVVREPQFIVPVPLGPGESLVGSQPQPQYFQPGVAPPSHAVLPAPGTLPAAPVPAASLLDSFQAGEAISPLFGLPAAPEVANRVPNPLLVPVNNPELAWDQIADVVSDFFPIAREQQVNFTDGVATAGSIETAPQIGATLLEPQRPDSVGDFNRWQSTFQTIRRRAVINVTPTTQGWAIAAQATKEQEDLPQPLGATTGAANLRNDQSLPTARLNEQLRTRTSDRWIPLGRDEPLEQELLFRIQQRLTGNVR